MWRILSSDIIHLRKRSSLRRGVQSLVDIWVEVIVKIPDSAQENKFYFLGHCCTAAIFFLRNKTTSPVLGMYKKLLRVFNLKNYCIWKFIFYIVIFSFCLIFLLFHVVCCIGFCCQIQRWISPFTLFIISVAPYTSYSGLFPIFFVCFSVLGLIFLKARF